LKKLLFSITAKDFRWDTFRSGGKGGQNQNKVESGVRCVHIASGAVGEARDSRHQIQNRRAAFDRCINKDEFRNWHKAECARRLNQPKVKTEKEIQTYLDEQMRPENLKIEESEIAI
jgi:protein subunit release factor B